MTRPHFVLSSMPTWSHIRALCVLASKIASARPITVTILVNNVFTIVEKITAEVARCLKEEGPAKGEVRIIAAGIHSTDAADALKVDTVTFQPIWNALVTGLPVRCSKSGVLHPAAARPSVVLLDGFQLAWFFTIRSVPSPPPVLQWMMGFSAGFLRIVGPECMGGRGDLLRAFSDADLENPKGAGQEFKGDVVRMAGMPPMYDWEFAPQISGANRSRITAVEAMMAKSIASADGLVTTCAQEYDGEDSLGALSSWIHQVNNRPTYNLGPLIPFKPGTCDFSKESLDAEMASAPDGVGEKAMQLLDRSLRRYGKCSVVYISFGTNHWPTNIEHVYALVYTLERRGIPFILTHSAPTARIPDDLRARFDNSEIGLLSPWSPQQAILAHEACGWFITHGGANGTIEAVSQGIPMVGWPFIADQPSCIARSVYLDIAFEFTEVRTGEFACKPILRTGETPSGTVGTFQKELDRILDAMGGEIGARKRANARVIRERLSGTWRTDGTTRKGFEKFLDEYCKLRG